jgi:5-methylcytosine-specific restriction endonuclease McrA
MNSWQRWYTANRDRRRAYGRHYDLAYRERRRTLRQQRRALARMAAPQLCSKCGTPLAVGRRNRRYCNGTCRLYRWRASNPERSAEQNQKSRARRAQAPVVGDVSRAAIFARDHGRCYLCGQSVEPDNFHLDHLVPLAKGGEHAAFNLMVAHPRCNWKKHTKRIPVQLPLDLVHRLAPIQQTRVSVTGG